MKPESMRALNWLAGVLIIAGSAIITPAGAIVCFTVAAICALFPTAFGAKMPRIVGAALLISTLIFIAYIYPKFKLEQEGYRKHAMEHASKALPPPSTHQETKK